ncbi:AlpA family phage regulatory protein [Salmonella enterica]|nr:AlpA family phage regulatory protein [Salmonella enterica]EHA9546176.1 AlpA family phage regulatory protein [Salmonella enterica subsp. enterica serovar Braenderup]EHP7123048.1 AlpA family phage regulatory protein [Salmonella enterica subsp. enterica serovar Thompson]EBH4941558.1 AlpA family phage regulatory protein [Salmonella enterica]ECK3278482.1 AlpA family phage regulatory protein [Salmonella enterica]
MDIENRVNWQTVIGITGLSRSTITRMINNREFPAPRVLSPRRHYWPREEIDAWLLNRPRVW